MVVADPASDTQALIEAAKMGIPVVAICDTDNITDDIDVVIPGNNRGRKALRRRYSGCWLALVLHELEGISNPDQQMKYTIDDFETKLLESDLEEEEEE